MNFRDFNLNRSVVYVSEGFVDKIKPPSFQSSSMYKEVERYERTEGTLAVHRALLASYSAPPRNA